MTASWLMAYLYANTSKEELLRPLPKRDMNRHGLTDKKYLEMTRKR